MWILRSVLAVAAGIVVFSLALFATEPLFGVAVRSTPGQLAWLVWLGVSMAMSGLATAWLAGRAPGGHAIAMAAIQAAMTFIAMLTVRSANEPRWFWLAGIVLMLPAAWAGAWIRSAVHKTRIRSPASIA